jgi:hypothetical protein
MREFLLKLSAAQLKKMIRLHNKQDNLSPYYKMGKPELVEAMMKFFTKAQMKTLAFKAGYSAMYKEMYPEASEKPRGRPPGAKNVVPKDITKKLRDEIKKAAK